MLTQLLLHLPGDPTVCPTRLVPLQSPVANQGPVPVLLAGNLESGVPLTPWRLLQRFQMMFRWKQCRQKGIGEGMRPSTDSVTQRVSIPGALGVLQRFSCTRVIGYQWLLLIMLPFSLSPVCGIVKLGLNFQPFLPLTPPWAFWWPVLSQMLINKQSSC